MLTGKEQSILSQLEGPAADNGIEIVTVEIVGAKKSPIIRVYIDTPQGVSFNELSAAQAWIGDLLDEIDPFPGAYTLEVSSPGIERPLRTEEHFRRFAGEEARIRTREPIEGRSNFKGVIDSVDDGCILIEADGEKITLPLSLMKRANLVGTFDFK